MTIIAWDGTTLAADRQTRTDVLLRQATKIRKFTEHIGSAQRPVGNYLMGMSGNRAEGLALMAWFEAGADPAKWPVPQNREFFAELLVISPTGAAWRYEHMPVALPVEDAIFAMGCGQDCAIGAMAAGETSIEAVRICIEHIDGCGGGVDWLRLGD